MHIDALDIVSSGLTVRVRIRNLWRLRLGLWLVRLAARTLRCRVRVDHARGRDDDDR